MCPISLLATAAAVRSEIHNQDCGNPQKLIEKEFGGAGAAASVRNRTHSGLYHCTCNSQCRDLRANGRKTLFKISQTLIFLQVVTSAA